MFKKTLLALAIAGVAGNAMAAANLAGGVTTRTVSVEGASSLTQVAADAVSLTLGAEYTVGDVLTFTFAGAELDTSALPVSLNPTLVDGNDTMTLGLLDATATKAVYRVTELTLDGALGETTVGATVDFAAETDLIFDAADVLASGSVSITYTAATSTNINLDTPTGTNGTATLIDTATQFSASVTAGLSSTIDVEQDRLAFTDATGDTRDSIVITPVNDSGDTEYDATATEFTYTIYGDWSILDSDPDTDGVQLNNAGAITLTNGTLDSVDATKIVVTHNAVAALTVQVDVSEDFTNVAALAAEPLSVQSFTVDVNVAYTDHGTDEDSTNAGVAAAAGDSDLADAVSGGEWDLNGSVVEVPYMPFGPNTQPILRHTNTGTQTGDISVRYMEEGVDSTWQSIGVVVTGAEPGVTNILSPVMDAVVAATGSTSGKVALEITTNVPAGDVTVYAAAKITTSDSDRLTIGAFTNTP